MDGRNGTCRCGDEIWRRLESLGDGHFPIFHIFEVDLPGDMDAIWVFLPGKVHLIYVICGVSLEERVAGILNSEQNESHSQYMCELILL